MGGFPRAHLWNYRFRIVRSFTYLSFLRYGFFQANPSLRSVGTAYLRYACVNLYVLNIVYIFSLVKAALISPTEDG